MKKGLAALVLCLSLLVFGMASAQVLELTGKETNKDVEGAIAQIQAAMPVEKVVFDTGVLKLQTLERLREAFPELPMEYSVSVLGKRARSTDEFINLYQTPVNGGKKFETLMSALRWLPNLTEIRALNSSFTYDEMQRIKAILPDVHVSCKLRINKHYVRNNLTAFSTRHSKTSTRYSSDDMRNLVYMDNLLALDIGHNAVTNLDFLYNFPQLKVLILADNRITDLTPIASLKELEYLEIFLNHELVDISPLAELENLLDLHAGSCNIADLSPLKGLKKLQRLWIGDNPYDEAQIDELREALPNCTINTTAWLFATTAEGWRQGHPHYLTIVDMFETGKYKEFKK